MRRAIVFVLAAGTLCAQPVDIRFGEPSVWSLDQAHYLLSRMRAMNMDLPTRKPDDRDLSANETNSTRLKILRTMLSGSVSWSQLDATTNGQLLRQYEENLTRRGELTRHIVALRADRDAAQSALARAKLARAQFGTDCPATAPACREAGERAAVLESRVSTIQSDIAARETELEALKQTQPPKLEGSLPEGAAGSMPGLTPDVLENLIEKSGADSPRLHASTMLDNYIQMQYEIIAKQVSLLRDEVGPGQRIMFLELPQSLNSHARRVLKVDRENVAQTFWRISGVYVEPKRRDEEGTKESKNKARGGQNGGGDSSRVPFSANPAAQNSGTGSIAKLDVIPVRMPTVTPRSNKDPEFCDRFPTAGALCGCASADELPKLLLDSPAIAEFEKACSAAEPDPSGRQLRRAVGMLRQDLGSRRIPPEKRELAARLMAESLEVVRFIQAPVSRVDILKRIPRTQSDSLRSILAKIHSTEEGRKFGPEGRAEQLACLDRFGDLSGVERCIKDLGLDLSETVQTKPELCTSMWNDPAATACCKASCGLGPSLDCISDKKTDESKAVGVTRSDTLDLLPVDGTAATRIVDLIPRQSAMNVNSTHATMNTTNIGGRVLAVLGIGAKVDYQRQRELYEQFLYQEVFATGFGKGSTDFGWRFGPLPGNKEISPGTRTTYAVAVVPEQALALRIDAVGCYFPRKNSGPRTFQEAVFEDGGECTPVTTFNVPLPFRSDSGLEATGIRYKRVPPGQRATVFITGNFPSPQTGVLVDGLPLQRTLAVTDQGLPALHAPGDQHGEFDGHYEVVNSNLIIASIAVPDTYKRKSPEITLVTPVSSQPLNESWSVLDVTIDGTPFYGEKWWEERPLFQLDERPPNLALDRAEVFEAASGGFAALVHGTFPDKSPEFRVNGRLASAATVIPESLYEVALPASAVSVWKIVAVESGHSAVLDVPGVPGPLRGLRCRIHNYEPKHVDAAGAVRAASATISLFGWTTEPQGLAVSGGKLLRHRTEGGDLFLDVDAPGRSLEIQANGRSACAVALP